MTDVLIVGGGPAGMTAAIYAARFGLSVVLLEARVCGGQLAETPVVENYPSFQQISGWELAEQMRAQAASYGVTIEYAAVSELEKADDGFCVKTPVKNYRCKTVIIANGVKRRKLLCPGEEQLTGKGVSWCAVCDGNFFRNKTVAVVGGGNSAVEDALYLSALCKKVYLVHRRTEFRADKKLLSALGQETKVEIRAPYVIAEIYGDTQVNGIKLLNGNTGEEAALAVDGVFEAIGLIPDNSMFAGFIKLDAHGYIAAGEDCRTSAPGVFAAGDTRTKTLRQVVTAASDGAVAAKAAFDFLY